MTAPPNDAGGGGKVTHIGARLAEARPAKPRGNGGLPEDCPVYALGQSGTHFWFLNTLQQIVAVPLGRMNGPVIQGLFSGQAEFLEKHWPKTNRSGHVVGFDNVDVANALLRACHGMGMYDGTQLIIRGRGAHPGEDGDLVLNLGYAIWARNYLERIGSRDDGFIYPRGNSLAPPPPVKQQEGPDGPAAMIEDVLRRWEWQDPVYPRLLLGWLAMASVGGALEWRAHVWINAPHGSGKSTLLEFLGAILDDLVLAAEDATAAALRTRMGNDTLAMILDETENKVDETRLSNLVEMARLSSRGGLSLRATSDQGSMAFTLRSAMLMASIGRPPLRSQDQSRFAMLKMLPHGAGKAPMFGKQTLRSLGRQLLRRMVDQFKNLPGVLDKWREALVDAGVKSGRDTDQYGILLACAELAMWDEPRDAAERARWAQSVAEITMDARTEQLLEWQRVLQAITSSMSGAYKGGDLLPLGVLIARAAQRQVVRDHETGMDRRTNAEESQDANARLSSVGLRVVFMEDEHKRKIKCWADDPTKAPSAQGDGDALGYLAVANSHATLNTTVFRNTHWAARSGTSGGWKAALQEAPGVVPSKVMKLGGVATRCVMVPLTLVLDGEQDGDE